MSHAADPTDDEAGEVVEEYVSDVRIVTVPADGDRYRFEAPLHTEVTFDDPDLARLYADVYFDVNGFREDGSGDQGIPIEIVQAGKDTLAAYLLTQPHTDRQWVASFYGTRPAEIDRYADWVSERAEEIRATARREGVE